MKKTAISIAALAIVAVVVTRLSPSALAHDMDSMDSGTGDSGGNGAMGQMGAHMRMGDHMTMTESRAATPAEARSREDIIKTARDKLAKYQDYRVAMADGYEPFMPTVPQDVYHFSSRSLTGAEYGGDFDLARPGSLLYERQGLGGYKLVGAMYSAPTTDDPAQLDKLIPLSLVNWHAHTNICLPAGVTEQDVMNGDIGAKVRPDISSAVDANRGYGGRNGERMRLGYMADPRFGFAGTISTEAECESAGGNFHKQIFGWMVHVYPFAGDDFKVAFSHDAP